MKKIISALIFCIGGMSVAHSQCAKIDSLYRVLRVIKTDTDSINTLNALAESLIELGRDGQASLILQKTLSMSKKASYDKGTADALTHIALMDYDDLNEYRGQIADYQKALDIYEELQDKDKIIKTLEIIAAYYYKAPDQESREKALTYYQKILNYAKQQENTDKIIQTYETLGELYGILERDDEAFASFEQAARLENKTGIVPSTNNRLLAKYRRIKTIERRLQNTNAFTLITIFGIIIAIMVFITVMSVLQRNKAYQQLKGNKENKTGTSPKTSLNPN